MGKDMLSKIHGGW